MFIGSWSRADYWPEVKNGWFPTQTVIAGTRCPEACLGVENDSHHPRSEGQVKHGAHSTQIKSTPRAAESTERPVTHGDRAALLFLSDPYSLGTARLTGLHMCTINTQRVGCFRPRHTAYTEASLKSLCVYRKFTDWKRSRYVRNKSR